jgi:hypothetical protein
LVEYIGILGAVSGTHENVWKTGFIFVLRYKNGDEPTQLSTTERPILSHWTADFGNGGLKLQLIAQKPCIISRTVKKHFIK